MRNQSGNAAPFPIRSVHQVEITSRCNLLCKYCPSPHLPRAKADMAEDVFIKALHWASVFVKGAHSSSSTK